MTSLNVSRMSEFAAIALSEKYISPRSAYMRKLNAYVAGTQYEGKPHFLDDLVDLPTLERAPCIVCPIVETVIQSNLDFILGHGREPKITSSISEEDRLFDPEFGLSKEDSHIFDKCIERIFYYSELLTSFRNALAQAFACGTAVVALSLRMNQLCAETLPAEWCSAQYDEHSGEVKQLEVRYPFVSYEKNQETQKLEAKCRIYRRLITTEEDILYKSALANPDGSEPIWTVEKKTTHHLGFCPVHWYAFMKSPSDVSSYDGEAIHSRYLDEIDALNFSLSQRHRASLYCGDPTHWQTGVDLNEFPTAPAARAARVQSHEPISSLPAFQPGPNGIGYYNYAFGSFSNLNPSSKKRKKGPGVVWTTSNENAKYGMLTLPADALDAISKHASDLKGMLCESMSILWLDPETTKFASQLSGKSLELLYKRQTARCDQVRADFGQNCILPVLHKMLRMIVRIESFSQGSIILPGIRKVIPILKRFEQEVFTEEGESVLFWLCPYLKIVWPHYFSPSELEASQMMDSIVKARQEQLLSKLTAMEKIKPFFGFSSTKDELLAMEEENEPLRKFSPNMKLDSSLEQELSSEPEESPPSSKAD